MSLVHPPLVLEHLPRKRTSSFSVAATSLASSPRPTKAPRTSSTAMGLRRTESYLVLPSTSSSTVSLSIASVSGTCRPSQGSSGSPTVPYHQSLQYYKDQRQRRKAATRASLNLDPITFRTRLECTYSQPPPQSCQPQQFQPSPKVASMSPHTSRSRPLSRTPTLLDVTSSASEVSTAISSASEPASTPAPFRIPQNCRVSSPLSPNRTLLPGRPVFPRSKPEPDLYRKAITSCMRASPEGQKILRMGPRLALSILTATQELERIVAEQETREDVLMEDRLSNQGSCNLRNEDWEMVDCGA